VAVIVLLATEETAAGEEVLPGCG